MRPTLIIAFLVTLFIGACTQSVKDPLPIAGPTATSTPVATTTPRTLTSMADVALHARAEEAYSVIDRRLWSDVTTWANFYVHTSPRYRAVCGLSDYTVQMKGIVLFLENYLGIPETAVPEFRIRHVEVSGIEGTVFTDTLVNGEPITELSGDSDRWTFVEGQWWWEDTGLGQPNGC